MVVANNASVRRLWVPLAVAGLAVVGCAEVSPQGEAAAASGSTTRASEPSPSTSRPSRPARSQPSSSSAQPSPSSPSASEVPGRQIEVVESGWSTLASGYGPAYGTSDLIRAFGTLVDGINAGSINLPFTMAALLNAADAETMPDADEVEVCASVYAQYLGG